MNAGLAWLTRRWLRQRCLALLPLALVLVLGTAATAIIFTRAERTATAFGDHVVSSGAADVVINPAVNTREIEDVIRSLPDVTEVTSDVGFTATLDDGAPRPRSALVGTAEESSVVVRGSADGRFVEMDRPVVRSGRMATGTDEIVVTEATARAGDIAVGDVIPVAFWSLEVSALAGEPLDAYMSEVTEPIAVETLEVVGIVTFADEVLPDELYPRQRAVVSPDVAGRYDCVPAAPPRGATMHEQHLAFLPPGCGVRYRFYALRFANGTAGVKPALDAFVSAADPLNDVLADVSDLPPDTEAPRYNLIAIETDQERRAVEQAIQPTVAALYVLAFALAAVTIVLAGLAVARELRRTRGARVEWHRLGVNAAERARVVAVPLVLTIVVAAALGLGLAWLVGPGPQGLVRVLDPDPVRRITGRTLLTVVGMAAVVLGFSVVAVWRSSRRLDAETGGAVRRRDALTAVTAAAPPVVADGLRAAYGRRSATPVIAGAAVLTAAFVATVVFGASLTGLLSTPRAYGWPWDVTRVTAYGYGGLDLDATRGILEADPAVASWTALGIVNDVSIAGEPMPLLIALDDHTDFDLTVLAGALPRQEDEIALGGAVASRLGVGVGDTVAVRGGIPSRNATVSGLVVLPTLGQFEGGRLGAGTGALVSERALADSPGFAATHVASSVGVQLRDDADTPANRVRLQAALADVDLWGFPEVSHTAPVRPPEIVDAASTRVVPTVVAAVFAAMAVVGLTFASWASVRARRRDLAIMQALGGDRRQVRRSIRVQSTATMAGALVIGVPVGLIIGRVLWRAFADRLGVLPDPASPWGVLAASVAVGLGIAVLASLVPAYLASRSTPVDGLRTE